MSVALIGLSVGIGGVVLAVLALVRSFWIDPPPMNYQRLPPAARGELEKRVRADPNDPNEHPADLPLLRTAAWFMVVQRNLLGVALGCVLLQVGCTLAAPTLVHWVLTGLFAVPATGVSGYLERRAASGTTFLSRHQVPASDTIAA
jgi:hypothetical protein